MGKYLTAPTKTTGMPGGVPYIVANEAAERFSFYGMRAILVVFMTQYLMSRDGKPDLMTADQAKAHYHLFASAVYFFPLLGAIISDALLGKYRTIIYLSILYCLGHLALALDSTRIGLAIGLMLIAVGSGGIKPCVSAHVGDQFGASNQHLLPKVFGWFYFSINLGGFVATLLIPKLLERFGPHVAFGTPGLIMLLATWFFWAGRKKFIHIPAGRMEFVKETFSLIGLKSMAQLGFIYLFIAVFWSLYDQIGSAWVIQAQKMDLQFLGVQWLPAQIQAINPILILLYVPLFAFLLYPAINKIFPLSPLRKISIGLFLAGLSFVIPAWIETQLAVGIKLSIGWQLLAYLIITAAEVLVSITCLEFSYTQAPRKMKSLVMAIFLLSISLGNMFTAAVNYFIQNPDGSSKLSGTSYYLFFAGIMLLTTVLFVFFASKYKEKMIVHDEMEIPA